VFRTLCSCALFLLLILQASSRTALAQDAPRATNRRVTEALERWQRADIPAKLGALYRLGRLGPRAHPAVPAIIPGLTHSDSRIRSETARTLGQIGSGAAPANSELLRALNDRERDVRVAVVNALEKTNPEATLALAPLVAAIRSS
jgi:HEAT repeat protein